MISPELLRRYPFFSGLNDSQLKTIAMSSNEVTFDKGDVLFEIDQDAHALFFLIRGDIDLHYVVKDRDNPNLRKEFYMGHINPGEPFGISALIEPHYFTATALAAGPCRVIEIGARALRVLCEDDTEAAAVLMRHAAQTAMSRLHDTRIQLIAARS